MRVDRDGQDGTRGPDDGAVDAQTDAGELLGRLRAELDRPGLGRLKPQVQPNPDPDGRRLAAVLILLYPHRQGPTAEPVPHLVLTRRTEELRRHSGQISLPGGRFDPADGSLVRTALRETWEELGVDPASLELWGRLEPERIVVSHYLVQPFVAYTPRRPDFRPSPSEVADVIEVPLQILLDPRTLVEESWDLQGALRQVTFYRHGEHKIWGATARVLGKLVALLTPESADHAAARLEPGRVWPERARPAD